MIINHNISALFAQRALRTNDHSVSGDMEKLSSGMRINRAGDDASGLAVSEKLRSQVRGLIRAERNASDGISFIQTTEGYLQETGNVLQRLRELAVQASNGIYSTEDRMQIQVEVSQLVDEVNRIGYDWDYSDEFSTDEIELIVDDVEYVIDNGIYEDPDVQLVRYYGLNWDHVNRIEAKNFCAI